MSHVIPIFKVPKKIIWKGVTTQSILYLKHKKLLILHFQF